MKPFHFLDSGPVSVRADPEQTTLAQQQQRPWTSYWPPEVDSELYTWLKTECPEALYWRFSPDDPFDRPWQRWMHGVTRKPDVSQIPGLNKAEDKSSACELKSVQTLPRKSCAERTVQRESGPAHPSYNFPTVTPSAFNYLADLEVYEKEKPYHSRLPFLDHGLRRTNIYASSFDDVAVSDVSGHEDLFEIDSCGFEYAKACSTSSEWNYEFVRSTHLPAVSEWLKDKFQCKSVHIYTYNFRCQDSKRTAKEAWIGPYLRAHCDVSANAGISRLQLHLPQQADDIQKGRWRFIGIWQPLTNPPLDIPLALCDARSVAQEDLIPADIVFPHYCDEGYEVRYSPAHKWYYKKQMTPDDMVVMKMYDSAEGVAKICPHSAFSDPSAGPEANQRASIEVRAILVG